MTEDALDRLRRDDAVWDAFVSAAAAPSYLQATPWAASKASNRWRSARIVTDGPNGPIGAQVLHRRAGPLPWRFGYAARGPVAGVPLDEDVLSAFTLAVRRDGRALGLANLRIDPEVEDPAGMLSDVLRAHGWREVAEAQPQRTLQIDLTQDEAALWSAVNRKWRQNTGRGARGGTRIDAGGRDDLAGFAELHRRSASRAGIPPRSLRAFHDLWDAFAPAGRIHLFLAVEPDGVLSAAQLVVGWGGTAAVLYSGITDDAQTRLVNYLLKWESIKAIKALGYRTFDQWGMPTRAIAEFKARWGGTERRWIGAWDLTLSSVGRAVIAGAIAGRAAAVRVRERVAGQRTRRRAARTVEAAGRPVSPLESPEPTEPTDSTEPAA